MRSLVSFILLLFISTNLWSQIDLDQPRPFKDHVRIGGSMNIGFGNSYSTIALSPSAVYDFTNSFSAGLSATYVYVKNKSTVNSTTNMLGGSILTLFRPTRGFQLSAEYERLKINRKIKFEDDLSRWQPALYFGLEYVTGNLSMGLRYDALFDKNDNLIYSSALSPIFRVYF